jgi:hypothetical protein
VATKKKNEPDPYILIEKDAGSFPFDGAMMVKDRKDLLLQLEEDGFEPSGEKLEFNVYVHQGTITVKSQEIGIEDPEGFFDDGSSW